MALTHNSTVANNEPSWGSVDKTRLPRYAHAIMGDPELKTSWKYPHHWVQDGGGLNDMGVYTTGDMYLHEGGLFAAGQRAVSFGDSEALIHINKHRADLGLDPLGAQAPAQSFLLLPRIAALIFNRPLAIEPARLDAIISVFDRKVGLIEGAGQVTGHADEAPPYEVIDGTAVIPIFGELVNRTYGLHTMSGLTSYPELGAMHAQALADPAVQDILLLINSPGGDVHGLFDLADQIAAARDQKPIAALASDYAMSAAYVLAAATGNVFVTQSAQVGSMGVVMEIRDTSAADQAAGVKRRKLYAGARKIDGSSHAPQTDEALAALQAEVDTYYEMLTAKVAGYLGTSQAAMIATEAGVYIGAQAIQQGLAHGMSTFDGMLTRTTSQPVTQITQPVLAGATKETAMEITTVEALTKAYPDLIDAMVQDATAVAKELREKEVQAAIHAEQERIREILGLAGYVLPKLVSQALWESGGLTGDKAARLFLEQKYEKTQAVASAFLSDAIEPAQIAPLSDSQQQLTPEQSAVNKQMGIDPITFAKYANVGLEQPARS